jgi:hypothetical protein
MRCGVFEIDKNCLSVMHFAFYLTTLLHHPIHNTSTIFPIQIERDVTYFDTSGFFNLYFAGFDNPTQLLQKQVGLQGNEETKPMCAKPVPMILGMEVALQLSFDQKCVLRQPNLWLNIPLRSCSAVAVLT